MRKPPSRRAKRPMLNGPFFSSFHRICNWKGIEADQCVSPVLRFSLSLPSPDCRSAATTAEGGDPSSLPSEKAVRSDLFVAGATLPLPW